MWGKDVSKRDDCFLLCKMWKMENCGELKMGTKEVYIDLSKQAEIMYSGKGVTNDPSTPEGTKKGLPPSTDTTIAVQMLEENLRNMMERGKTMALPDLKEYLGEYFWVRLLKEIGVTRIPVVYMVGIRVIE